MVLSFDFLGCVLICFLFTCSSVFFLMLSFHGWFKYAFKMLNAGHRISCLLIYPPFGCPVQLISIGFQCFCPAFLFTLLSFHWKTGYKSSFMICVDDESCAASAHPEKDAKRSYIPRRLVIGNDEYVAFFFNLR